MPGSRFAAPLATGGTLLIALSTAACGGRAPAVEAPTPAAGSTAVATAPAGAVATRFTWGAGERRVEVRTEAAITRDGPPAPAERVVTTAYVTAALAPGAAPGATEVQGAVDSLIVDASPRVRGDTAAASTATAAPRALLTGLRFRAASDPRGVRVEAVDPATDLRCTAPTGAATLGALAAVREALPRLPADLAAGARWRDTTVTASCAGPVLLVAQTVSRYESDADPAAAGRLRVTRQSTTTARGQGAVGARPMVVVASGTARAVYALDPVRGQLVGGSAEGRTTVTVTMAGVAQRFTQQTRTQLAVR